MKTKRKWAIRNGISPSNNLIIPPAGRLQRLHICPLRRNRRTARRRRPHCRSGRRNGCKNLRFHRKIRVRGSVPASGPAPAVDSPGRAAAPRRGIRPCRRRQLRGRASATLPRVRIGGVLPPIFSSQVPSRPAISRWLGLVLPCQQVVGELQPDRRVFHPVTFAHELFGTVHHGELPADFLREKDHVPIVEHGRRKPPSRRKFRKSDVTASPVFPRFCAMAAGA